MDLRLFEQLTRKEIREGNHKKKNEETDVQ